jgi:hypothetical protein
MIRVSVRIGASDMPVARYFLFVGGVLLALLFVLDAELPKLPVADHDEAGIELPVVRIHSDRKWPERVVFDTSVPTIVPAPLAKAEAIVPAPTMIAGVSATARVRDAFAQLEPAYPRRQEQKPQPKHKTARNRVAAPMVVVAQQPRFGTLANNAW